jgi:hypothetical protein
MGEIFYTRILFTEFCGIEILERRLDCRVGIEDITRVEFHIARPMCMCLADRRAEIGRIASLHAIFTISRDRPDRLISERER